MSVAVYDLDQQNPEQLFLLKIMVNAAGGTDEQGVPAWEQVVRAHPIKIDGPGYGQTWTDAFTWIEWTVGDRSTIRATFPDWLTDLMDHLNLTEEELIREAIAHQALTEHDATIRRTSKQTGTPA